MSRDRTATFRLKGKLPDDLTIERLAQYLRTLSQLVGANDKVRIAKIGRGSVLMSMHVDPTYYSELVVRVAGAANPRQADASTAKAVAALQEMVTADRVDAEFVAGDRRLLFLKSRPPSQAEPMGPFSQPYVVRGRLLGLEGKDRTKHARIAEFGTEREIPGEIVDNDLARKLREHLWGGVIELVGTGRLMRTREGQWELRSFRIDSFSELSDTPPSGVISGLRAAIAELNLGADPVNTIRKLRG